MNLTNQNITLTEHKTNIKLVFLLKLTDNLSHYQFLSELLIQNTAFQWSATNHLSSK